MGKFSKPVASGLILLCSATSALGASGAILRTVPEPAIFALAGIGLILIGLLRPRRRE